MRKHGDRYVWINPPAIPLSTEEMDSVFALQYGTVASGLWRSAVFRLTNDDFGQHYARLLWRLLFLFYHNRKSMFQAVPEFR
ncbi:hypothetical protein ACLB1Q_26980 [Escherichia coli]